MNIYRALLLQDWWIGLNTWVVFDLSHGERNVERLNRPGDCAQHLRKDENVTAKQPAADSHDEVAYLSHPIVEQELIDLPNGAILRVNRVATHVMHAA
jgi:hypothetical protein